MAGISYREFLDAVGRFAALGAGDDFVIAAVERERVAHRGVLHRERIQEVAEEARERAGNYIPAARSRENGKQPREFVSSPDAAFLSKAFASRLEPWAKELREECFDGCPDAPFPGDLAAAADWIEAQVAVDRERWMRNDASRLDADKEIRRLADLAGLVVKPLSRFLKYVRPDYAMGQDAPAFPDTVLDRLARETYRVSERTAFQPETLTGFVLTGLQPMISRVRIKKHSGSCRIPGDFLPSRSVTLTFNAADLSYDEVRALYAEIREFFGVADKERLSWPAFDFISLVDSMGGPPGQNKTRFWKEVLRRWEEEPASKYSPLSSWRAARNKFERLDDQKNLRQLTMPKPPLTPEELKSKHAAITKRLQSR